MHSLSFIDYIIIGGYLAVSLCAGFLMTRKASSNLNEYFLGGRSLPWWLLGVAGMANWFDLTGTMIITSFLYMLGPRGLYIEFRGGAVLVLAFLLAYAGKWHRRSGCMTPAEWMTYRFGTGKTAEGVRFLSAVIGIISTVMMLAYMVRGASLFLGMFFPFPPMVTTFSLVAVTTLYTMSAGFYGVVLTDFIQGMLVVVSCLIISVMAWMMVPDTASLQATAQLVTGNPSWTDSAPAWHTPMPPGYEAYSPLIMLAGFYLLRNVIGGMGGGAESRYFGARSDRDCGLQSMLQGFMVMFRWPLMIGFAVMGIYLVHSSYPDTRVIGSVAALVHSYYPAVAAPYWHDLTNAIINNPAHYPTGLVDGLKALLGPNWQARLPLVGFHGTINPEEILPAVLLNQVPGGLRGVLVVALFAAMTSCQNGLVNPTSALFVRDIYQNFLRPKAKNRELIISSYCSTLAIVVTGFYIGVMSNSINDLWSWLVMSLTAGGLGPLFLRLYWWRCNAWGMLGGLLLGATAPVIQRIWWHNMPEVEQFTVMTLLSFGGTIIGSLITKPTPVETVRHFYRTTRPFGLWGPFLNEFKGEERAALIREHRNDIITVPFAMVCQVTAFLMPMQLIIKSYHAFYGTLTLFLIAAAGVYWFWWRPLPKQVYEKPDQELVPHGGKVKAGHP